MDLKSCRAQRLGHFASGPRFLKSQFGVTVNVMAKRNKRIAHWGKHI